MRPAGARRELSGTAGWTYILKSEPGTSLRAAGWRIVGETTARFVGLPEPAAGASGAAAGEDSSGCPLHEIVVPRYIMVYSSRAALRAVLYGPPKQGRPETPKSARLFEGARKKCSEMSGFSIFLQLCHFIDSLRWHNHRQRPRRGLLRKGNDKLGWIFGHDRYCNLLAGRRYFRPTAAA
jgi:hypothetical protein